MNKYFNGDKLSGYEDSPITYVYGGNLEECHKVIADLEAKLAENEKFMKDNGFKNLEELDDYIQKIHSHYDEIKNKGTCGLCEKIDNEQIKELKQQLAESEKLKDDALYNYAWLNQELSDTKQKLKDNENAYKILCCNHQNLGMAYNELEQQLAQKDKEIEKLKTTNDRLYKKNKKLENQIVESNIRFYKKGALEQLEKVKEKLLEELDNVTELLDPLQYEDYHEFIGCGRGYKNSIEEIDNQIKAIKEKR